MKKSTLFKFAYILGPYILVMILNKVGIVNSYIMQVLMLAGINIIMTVSLNLVNGVTGQFSIGHAGFMSVGAYASAVFTTGAFKAFGGAGAFAQEGIFVIALIFGGLVAAFFGFLIAQPTLKVKGDYLAIVTLGFGEVIRALIRVIDYVGGPRGMTGIPKMTNFTWVYIIAMIAIFSIRNFIDSRYGRSCLSIRENEIAADTMGVNTLRYKTSAFTFASFWAGIAGGLFGHLLMYIQPDSFAYAKSSDYLVYLYAGGVGTISGSIVGAFTLTVLPELLRFMADWRLVIYAIVLLYMIIFRPNGIMGGREFSFLNIKSTAAKSPKGISWFRKIIAKRKGEKS